MASQDSMTPEPAAPNTRVQTILREAISLQFLVLGIVLSWLSWMLLRDSWIPSDGIPWFPSCGFFVLLVFVFVYRRPWKIILWICMVCISAFAMFAPHPRKDFLRDLHRIQPGMATDNAVNIMGKYRGGEKFGLYVPPRDVPSDATGTWYVGWNNDDGDYDADLGAITFDKGKVTQVEFLAD